MSLSRRNFLKTSAIGVAALSASNLPRVHAGEDNLIKVALIGCGGRGRGAAANTLNADPNCKIVAVADAFMPKAKGAVEGLEAAFGDRIDVGDRIFAGLDAYKDAIDAADLVLLCEAPGFRYRSLEYAVAQGKHVFCEKPVATDVLGIRSVMESTKIAKLSLIHI